MRLPYLQLAEKFITVQSKMIARILSVERTTAIGMGTLLFETVLEMTSSETSPPTGVILGDDAADIIEAAIEWKGERGKGFGAFVRADVIEQLESGARVKGCDRYKDAWSKQRRRIESAKAAAQARWGTASCVSTDATASAPHANRIASASPPHAPRSAQTETETETEKKLPLPAAADKVVSLAPDPDEAERQLKGDEGSFQPTGLGFCGWWNDAREAQGLTKETFNIADTAQWADRCMAEVGQERFWRAAHAYLDDEFWRLKGWPLAVFRSDSVWRTRANDPAPPRRARQ